MQDEEMPIKLDGELVITQGTGLHIHPVRQKQKHVKAVHEAAMEIHQAGLL